MLNKNRIRTKSGTPNLGTCLNALLKHPSISEDYRYVLWSRWTRQRLLRLHSPMREWQSLSNVCRCGWWRLCGVFFLSCLLSSDVPPRPTTLHIFLALGSQPISNVSGQNWWSPRPFGQHDAHYQANAFAFALTVRRRLASLVTSVVEPIDVQKTSSTRCHTKGYSARKLCRPGLGV